MILGTPSKVIAAVQAVAADAFLWCAHRTETAWRGA